MTPAVVLKPAGLLADLPEPDEQAAATGSGHRQYFTSAMSTPITAMAEPAQ